MNWPSIAGWFNIAAVTLNMAGVLILFWFRGEAIVPMMPRDSLLAAAARNLALVPKLWVGVVMIGLSWALQVLAQFPPTG